MLLCEEVEEMIMDGKLACPCARLEGPPSKKRKHPALVAVKARPKNKGKQGRGFYLSYDQASQEPPRSRHALLCYTVRSGFLEGINEPLETREEVPKWWGKISEMLAAKGITLNQ